MQRFTEEEQHVLFYLSSVLADFKEQVANINLNTHFREKICQHILKLSDLRVQMKMFEAFGLNAKVVDVRTVFLADESLPPVEYCDRLLESLKGEAFREGIELLNVSLLLNVTANYRGGNEDELNSL